MLALGIRYLNGFATATASDSYERVEWPPHPGRVFMALAAAHFQTGSDPRERDALLWLESLDDAPAIRAGDHEPRALVTHFVPVNDKAGPAKSLLQSAPLTRERQPRSFARAFLDDDIVYLLWPQAVLPDSVRNVLAQLCAKVTRIGHSSSLVQMWLAEGDEPVAPTWVPEDERPVVQLRVAGPGTLVELERCYNVDAVQTYADLQAIADDDSDKKAQRVAKARLKAEFSERPPPQQRPQLALYQGYGRPALATASRSVHATVFNPHFTVVTLRREDGPYRHLDLACVLAVTQRLRDAVLSHSNDRPSHIRSLLSGHDANGSPLEKPHLAFLPLAFVDHPHADGHLLGLGIVLPAELSRDERRHALHAVAQVRQLKLGRLGVWNLTPHTALRPVQNLRPEVWTAHGDEDEEGATVWATVTPVVYDRHPKWTDPATYRREVARMIGAACTHIGLPEPREVVVTGVSALEGVPPAASMPRLQRKDGSERRHVHAILVFERPVLGPILIGAGRYRGYGVCRPMNWERADVQALGQDGRRDGD